MNERNELMLMLMFMLLQHPTEYKCIHSQPLGLATATAMPWFAVTMFDSYWHELRAFKRRWTKLLSLGGLKPNTLPLYGCLSSSPPDMLILSSLPVTPFTSVAFGPQMFGLSWTMQSRFILKCCSTTLFTAIADSAY